jgi:hypothetical protein
VRHLPSKQIVSQQQRIIENHREISSQQLFLVEAFSFGGGNELATEASNDDIPFYAEVTAGGRVTIPEEIRKIFEIKDGDAVFCKLKIIPRKKNSATPK